MRISDWSSDVCSSDLISDDDGTLLAEQIYAMNRAQIDAPPDLDTVNQRLARLAAAVSARGSTAAFDGVESTVLDQLRLEALRLAQVESALPRTLESRHPRLLPLRSEVEQRRQTQPEDAARM